MSIGDPFMPGFYFKQNTRSTKLFKCFFKTHIKQSQQQQQPMGGGENTFKLWNHLGWWHWTASKYVWILVLLCDAAQDSMLISVLQRVISNINILQFFCFYILKRRSPLLYTLRKAVFIVCIFHHILCQVPVEVNGFHKETLVAVEEKYL